jgi:4-amino-4-deoxy-L-arabinose transferase-like glycosyltransferase
MSSVKSAIKPWKWSESKRDIFLLIAISLALKLVILLFVEAINSDGVLYITAAQEFAKGHFKEGFRISRMPFYPLLIVIFHSIVRNWVAAARLVSLLTSVLSIIPLYLLTKKLFERKAALWACVAFAISPLPNHLSVEVIRDPAYLFFFAWTIYFAHDAVETNKLWFFLMAGAFSVFAFLCRMEGLILFPCLIVFFLYIALKYADKRKIIFKGTLIYLAIPIGILSAFILYLQSKDRFFFARIKHFNRLSYIKYHLQDVLRGEFFQNYKLIYSKMEDFEQTLPRKRGGMNFAEVARHHMYAVYFIGLLEGFFNAVFPPYIIPLVVGLRKSQLRRYAFLFFVLTCYLLLLYFSYIKRDTLRVRHLLAPALLLYPLIGLGLQRIANYFSKGTWKRWLIIIAVIFLGLGSIYNSVDILWKQDDVVVRAGQWLGKRALRKEPMITTDRRVPFYAGRSKDYVLFRDSDYRAMELLAVEKGYDVLVIRTSKKRITSGPQLARFKKVKEFVGVKDIVSVYIAPNFRSKKRVKDKG